MFRTLLPIFALIVAVALFFTYIRPTFEDVKIVQDETHQYEEAVDKAGQLQQRIDELKRQRNQIPIADLERVEALLPDDIDEVLVLIDLDALATEHNLILTNVVVDSGSIAGGGGIHDRFKNADAPGAVSNEPFSSLDIGFGISGSYDDFREFLSELERSLVLTDVVDLQFAEDDGEFVNVALKTRFYSLN